MKFKWFTLIVIIFGFLGVGRSLQFSLGGDDWLALYRYKILFNSFISHFQFSNYIGNYDAANIIMGLINRVFSYNPFPYYFISLIFRIFAAVTFYPMLYTLTKNRLLATLAGLFFVSAYAGIETTNWVFNMSTYLSIAMLNLSLWNYISTFKKNTLAATVLQVILIFLAFYFTPNRMHALVFIIPFLELIKLEKIAIVNFLKIVLRIALFLLPIFLFRFATGSEWDKGYLSMLPNLQDKGYNIVLYLITNIGSILFPDKILNIFISNYSQPKIYEVGNFLLNSLLVSLVYILIIYLLSFSVKRKLKFIKLNLLGMLIFITIFWISLQGGKINNFGNLMTFTETLIGGYTLITLSIYFYFQKRFYPILASAGAISLFFTISFLIAPWLTFTGAFPSEHRYLTVSTAMLITTIAIFLAILWAHKNRVSTTLVITLVIILLTVNFFSLQLYFNNYLSHGRRADYVTTLFKQLVSQVEVPKNDKPLVFLFLTDNQFTLYNAITFGFPYHMMLIDPRLGMDFQKSPFPVDNMESLINVLSGPESKELYRYGYDPVQIPLENVYAFNLQNKNLTNITPEVRNSLEEKLPHLKKI